MVMDIHRCDFSLMTQKYILTDGGRISHRNYIGDISRIHYVSRERLHEVASHRWHVVTDHDRQKMSRMAAAAAWGLGQWDCMEEYSCMIPRDTYDGAFYRAVLALHMDQFALAQQVGVKFNLYSGLKMHEIVTVSNMFQFSIVNLH